MELELNGFSNLGLSEKTLIALEKKGFKEPTEIQKLCIPLLLKENTEVIGQAQTGTGKTAAFALPIIETLEGGSGNVEALVLCPTRELAIQVSEEIESLKGERRLEVAAIYGGSSMENQFKRLRKGVDVIVGTPGRVLDHIRRKSLNLENLKFAVLDEADEMLDMGFIEDIEAILEVTPEEKRMLMFSATMPREIQKIAERFMKNYELVRTEKKDVSSSNTHQIYFEVREADKLEALMRVIDREVNFYGVIFCRTKLQCEEIGGQLISRGYDAGALHGDLSQREREVMLKKMKEKQMSILVATDVASRGLDIQELTHVINYSIPEDPEVYIHRVGRTGRAGKEGTAITFITPREVRKFAFIQKTTSSHAEKMSVPEPEEVIESKKKKIIEETRKLISSEPNEDFMRLAFEILSEKDAFMAFSSLLESMYKKDLDVRQYKAIRKLERKKSEKKEDGLSSKDGRRKERSDVQEEKKDEYTRLFIARGRRDGLTKRSLANIMIDQVGVRDEDLVDITVMEDFSFLNAPERVARRILDFYTVPRGKGKSLVTRAKAEEGGRKFTRDADSSKKKRQHKAWLEDTQPYGRDSYGDEEDGGFRMPEKRTRGRKKDSASFEKKSRKKRR